MFKISLCTSLAVVLLLALELADAHNKVVVVPMAGDNVAMAEEHFRYTQDNISDNSEQVDACTTDLFMTPSQITQAHIVATASTASDAANDYWNLRLMVKVDEGDWEYISPEITGYSSGPAGAWSHLTATESYEMDPNTIYQFRVRLEGLPMGTVGYHTCELLMSVTYKLPEGNRILEILPDN